MASGDFKKETISIKVFLKNCLNISLGALSPERSFTAFMIIDLPAPVSPVIMFR